MAIAGLKKIIAPVAPAVDPVVEATDITVELLTRLGLVEDEQALRTSLTDDFTEVRKLGEGRLYVSLDAGVPTSQLIALANELAVERGFSEVFEWKPFWVPGTEPNSVTEEERNGSVAGYAVRVALFCAEATGVDPLLRFTGLSYDGKHRQLFGPTQLSLLEKEQARFTSQHSGASLRAADHRDFLVWYIMDLLRGVPADQVVLAKGFMRIPVLGRRSVDGDSYVGDVNSNLGLAYLGRSCGRPDGESGLGLSAGFNS